MDRYHHFGGISYRCCTFAAPRHLLRSPAILQPLSPPKARSTLRTGRALLGTSTVACLTKGLRMRNRSCSALGAEAEELTLPVISEGSGEETLFFVHGWPDDAHLWDAQVAHFKDSYRCLRVTMPHFGGRAEAQKLKHRANGYDFEELGEVLAATIRRETTKPVILVLHDWGCIWGFFAQHRAPKLVKAIVAMDVGPPSYLAATGRSLPMAVGLGLVYQYWLWAAHVLSRSSASTCFEPLGQKIADSITRTLAWVVKRPDYKDKNDAWSERITADACYPYTFFQRDWGVKNGEFEAGDGAAEPSCPCLFLYGDRKPIRFHSTRWEDNLRARPLCKVLPVRAGHWLQIREPHKVNQEMDDWLSATLPQLD